jgi:hypothetical protein
VIVPVGGAEGAFAPHAPGAFAASVVGAQRAEAAAPLVIALCVHVWGVHLCISFITGWLPAFLAADASNDISRTL